MKKIIRFTTLAAMSALCIGAAAPEVMATKYTTRDTPKSDQQAEQEATSDDEENQNNKSGENNKKSKKGVECTNDHISAIRSFNGKAIAKKGEFEDLLAGKDDVDTAKEAKEFTKKLERLQSFYNSQEFALMEKIYALCGQDLPRPKESLPFFLPEDLGLGDQVDAI